jgi:hypothetical protein
MSGRRIRKGNHGVTVEVLQGHPDEAAVTELAFSEVRLLSNGWAECRDPADGSDRREFFPPDQVVAVRVDGEDEPSVTWG